MLLAQLKTIIGRRGQIAEKCSQAAAGPNTDKLQCEYGSVPNDRLVFVSSVSETEIARAALVPQ